MFELTIGGTVYQFKFGMGFLRDMNKKINIPVDGLPGVKENVGLRYAVGMLFANDIETLVEVLFAANKGFQPRITAEKLDAYIEDEVEDIDELFREVLDFLKSANATKKTVAELQKVFDKQNPPKNQD
jgi:hypothetical protein